MRFSPTLGLPQPEYYDFGLRWYEPTLGRFLNRDPISTAGGSNVYAFVGNNPFGGWDAWGLSEEREEERVVVWGERINDEEWQLDQLEFDHDEMVEELQQQIEEMVSKILRLLCASKEGREFVQRLSNDFSVYGSFGLFPDAPNSMPTGGAWVRGTSDVYINLRMMDPVFVRDVGNYRWEPEAFMLFIIYHEVQEHDLSSNSPSMSRWERESHANFNSDYFLERLGLDPVFEDWSLDDHMDWNRPSPSSPGYQGGREMNRGDFLNAVSDRIQIAGWDCDKLSEGASQ